ncbi:solute carrier family 22 member 6-B-like [Tubulanus polymorphus]|uniref:solute carrier family 22 member 6-B-like n=1 Tax=Tubulanus polymorphus TaxID=672921 RepID=UPI003DA60994
MDNIDEVLESLGKYGRWQMTHLLFIGFSTGFVTAFSSLGIVFQGWTPPHHCSVDGKNSTLNQTIPFVIDANSGASSMDKCNMYEYPGQTNRNTTVPCQNGYTYDSDGYYTLIEEVYPVNQAIKKGTVLFLYEQFSWVCDKAIMNSMAQTVYYSGVLFGSFCFAPFADYFGRKYTSIITGVVAAMSHLIGGVVGSYLCASILVFECFPTKHRSFANSILMTSWSLGMAATGITGYLVKNWQHFQILASCLLASAILGIWVYDESIPWLVANSRHDEANRILEKASKQNKIPCPRNSVITLLSKEDKVLDDSTLFFLLKL